MAKGIKGKPKGMDAKRCTKKRCQGGHSWWARIAQRYYWCPFPGGRESTGRNPKT